MRPLIGTLQAIDPPGALDLGGAPAGAVIPWWVFGLCAAAFALCAVWLSRRGTLAQPLAALARRAGSKLSRRAATAPIDPPPRAEAEASLRAVFERTARRRGLARPARQAVTKLAGLIDAPPVALLISEHAFDRAAHVAEQTGTPRAELLTLRSRLFHA